MSRIKSITRRSFLIGSTAVAGGVVFGCVPRDNPLEGNLKEGEAALTHYVRIAPHGVTLITPHTDLGQGAHSMQAALIAEELDIEFGQFRVDPGEPSAVYYNTALGNEMAPFMATDRGFAAELTRDVMGGVVKLMGLQVTGGSSSVADSFEKLRVAGAVARETLKLAAAKKSGLPVDRLTTSNGAVHLPDGSELKYTELAAIAATLTPVNDVELRDAGQWRMIGKPMQRLDVVGKSTGAQVYGIDLAIDGMVHATLKLNPRQGGTLEGFDAGEAQNMKGVRRIVPVMGGVAVVADSTWQAIQAANAIRFEWGPSAYPAEMDGHWKLLGDAFNEDQMEARPRDDGNVSAALKDADGVEAEYRAPYLAHAPMEPLSAIVKVTDERVDIWTCTQMPRFVQNNAATITGLDADQVFVHVQRGGGSFGHRLEDEHVKRTTEVAMVLKGTPVKLTYSRETDFAHDFPRQIAMGRMKGAVKNGRVEAYDLGISMPSPVTSQTSRQDFPAMGPDSQITAGAWDQPFAIPHYRMTGYRAEGLAPISSWRSVGASTNAFFFDGFLDELIHAAGADPLEERLRLVNDRHSRKVLEAVGEMSGWGNPLSPNRGRGVAFCLSFGVPCAEVVEVTNTEEGIRIDKVFAAAEVGTIVDPVNFDSHVKGAVIWGLGHAMNCEITYSDGMAEQANFTDFEGMRMNQCPEIQVRGLENSDRVKGIGEPPVPPAAPALANAIFAATGKRLREMPFNKHIDFV